ncbi:MAG TPA: thioredoxin family protein [Burkholderiaceae bacterium]|nr:thioredoxin family protein [Burkholderiaceae bacterium]
MAFIILQNDNRAHFAHMLASGRWIVACLCAAWCDSCRKYRADFEQLATRHPGQHFVWIDIEDQAEIVGDLDVENFPTLLMQRGDVVAFYGPVQPDARVAERLLLAQTEKSEAELQAEATGSTARAAWQRDCNLRKRLAEANDG